MSNQTAVAGACYQHLIDSVRRDVAKQVGGLLWDADPEEGEDDEDGDGDALVAV